MTVENIALSALRTRHKRFGDLSKNSRRLGTLLPLVLLLAVVAPPARGGQSSTATDVRVERFDPEPISDDRFEVGAPEFEYVTAPDGSDMYVEVFRPTTAASGVEVPREVPVILVMTPYEGDGGPGGDATSVYHLWRDYFVPKGFAFAISHVYGTGNSEGCLELFGPNEVAATAAVVQHLGSAEWSSGRVGMFGTSYDAGHALHAAARGSAEAKRYLKAVVSEAGLVSGYSNGAHDGVPFSTSPASNALAYAPFGHFYSLTNAGPPRVDPASIAARQAGLCRGETMSAAVEVETTGDFSRWFGDRTARTFAAQVRAATLMFHGFHDWQLLPNAPVGFFDQLPQHVPHNLVLGQWQHTRTVFNRSDFMDMVHAWFDRYLLDLPTHTEKWPAVQVEDSEGRWRAERDWPTTGGPAGQLALGGGGVLGTTTPTGSTSYAEADISSTSTEATFTTPPLTSPLRIAGLPVLDLWLRSDRPDAHIAATLHAFDADGNRLTSEGGIFGDPVGRFPVMAYRSLRHLEPITEGEFRQGQGRPAPTGTPIHVPVRFAIPVDLVVPRGGSLTITIAGTSLPMYPSAPSGAGAVIEILHNCEHPSVLRFTMPDDRPKLLSVGEGPDPLVGQSDPNPVAPTGAPTDDLSNDGGVASKSVCGDKPVDPFAILGS